MIATLEALIAQRKTRRGQYVFIAVMLLAVIIEGIDMQLLSLMAPMLLNEWHVEKAALGPALSAALIGMGLGALGGGWLGDRFGRKAVTVGSVLCFGLATAAISVSSGLGQLTVLRLIGGLGFGAVGPNAIALLSEWLSGPLRVKAMSLYSIGTPLGGALGAAVLMGLLASLGWRHSFAVFGACSALSAAAILLLVPESPAYLVLRGRIGKAAGLISRWIDAPVDLRALRDAAPDGAAAGTRGAWRFDLGVSFRCFAGTSLCAIGTAYVAYASIAWFPVLLTSHGLVLAQALGAMFWFNTCALASSVATAYLLGWLGSRRLMLLASAVVGAAILALFLLLDHGGGAAIASGTWPVSLATALTGWGTGTLLTSIYLVIALRYPTFSKSTGLGVAMLLGRFGAIASTYFGGALLGSAAGAPRVFFLLLMAGALLAAAGVAITDRHVDAGVLAKPSAARTEP